MILARTPEMELGQLHRVKFAMLSVTSQLMPHGFGRESQALAYKHVILSTAPPSPSTLRRLCQDEDVGGLA